MTKREIPTAMKVTKVMMKTAESLWNAGFGLKDLEDACALRYPALTDNDITGVGFVMTIYAEVERQALLKLAASDPEKVAQMMRQVIDREAPDAPRKKKLAILSEVSAEVWPSTLRMKR